MAEVRLDGSADIDAGRGVRPSGTHSHVARRWRPAPFRRDRASGHDLLRVEERLDRLGGALAGDPRGLGELRDGAPLVARASAAASTARTWGTAEIRAILSISEVPLPGRDGLRDASREPRGGARLPDWDGRL